MKLNQTFDIEAIFKGKKYNSLDALHQLLSGKVKKKPKPEFDD